jgi:hypothetical protein
MGEDGDRDMLEFGAARESRLRLARRSWLHCPLTRRLAAGTAGAPGGHRDARGRRSSAWLVSRCQSATCCVDVVVDPATGSRRTLPGPDGRLAALPSGLGVALPPVAFLASQGVS